MAITDNPLISIVIVNFNGVKYLEKCITSVLNSSYPFYEIVIVDNGSIDGSVELIQKKFAEHIDKIILLPQKQNIGFSLGNNVGASKTRGDYILFLNNDTEVDSSCLEQLVKVMTNDKSIGATQAKLLLLNNKDTYDSAGNFINVVGFVKPSGYQEKDEGQYDFLYEISYAKGAAMALRRDVWIKSNGFEPLFSCYFEDVDLCWRVHLSGHRIMFVPSAIVYHVGGFTTRTLSRNIQSRRKIQFQDYRNRIVTVIKNLELKNLVKYSSWLFGMYLYYIFRDLVKNDAVSVESNFRSIFWCLRSFRVIWQKRILVQRDRVVTDNYLFNRNVLSKSVLFSSSFTRD